MTPSLRVGIAGYGLAGRHFHAPLLRGSGFDLVGVLTTNVERARQAREDFPKASIASTIDELLDLRLDLLVVASATIVHLEQALAGLKAGVPVVVDKPMGLTFAQTEMMVRTSEALGVPITVFFNRRWDSDSLTVKKVMREGLLGDVFRVDSRFERFRPSLATATWREKYSPDEGGGLLLDLQSHLISTVLDLFGSAELGYASVKTIRGGADDDVLLVLNHASGVDSYLSASAIIGAPGPRLRVNGTRGTLIINELDPQEALLRSGNFPVGGHWNVPTKSKAVLHRGEDVVEVESENGNYAQFYELVKGALEGKNPWPVSTDDALAVASIIDEARASSVR
ncbi:MAG TPA: Gfo/Idh/MocA family oxidoreductase [Candidatus Nanopelagicaceae bacterium]|jgi:predicted dehydrogenase